MPYSPLHVVSQDVELEPVEEREASRSVQLVCPMTLQRYSHGKLAFKEDLVAVEADLRVRINRNDCATLKRTPGDDLSLVVGHMFTNCMIRESGDVADCVFSYQSLSRAEVTLRKTNSIRRLFPSPRPAHIAPERLFDFKRTFEQRQSLYKNTRSTHAAALFSIDGELVSYGEDVGRHNAFDKAIGRALLESSLDRVEVAMLSSRLALELVTKTSTANIPILCGFSAATSSGINYAEKYNITLIGGLRENSFNVYANGWRMRA